MDNISAVKLWYCEQHQSVATIRVEYCDAITFMVREGPLPNDWCVLVEMELRPVQPKHLRQQVAELANL